MPAPSLVTLAQNTAMRRNKDVHDVGPEERWNLLAPIVQKIDSPSQLELLETNSPWLKEYTQDVWIRMVKRIAPKDIDPKLLQPKEGRNWAAVYQKLKSRRERLEREQAQILAARMKEIEEEKTSKALNTDVKGSIRTANCQGNRCHWSQTGRNLTLNTKPGQMMLRKARHESNTAHAVRTKSIKPVAPLDIREARQAGPNGRAHLERAGPAPLDKNAMAMLKRKRDREAGRSVAQPCAMPAKITKPVAPLKVQEARQAPKAPVYRDHIPSPQQRGTAQQRPAAAQDSRAPLVSQNQGTLKRGRDEVSSGVQTKRQRIN